MTRKKVPYIIYHVVKYLTGVKSMKVKVVYFTKSGNTKKVAHAIAEELSCSISSIEEPIEEALDVLFVGASAYNFGLDPKVIHFLENLDTSNINKIALFSTSWVVENINAKMAALLRDKEVEVITKDFYCKGKFLLANRNHPNEDDIIDAKKFARDIMHLIR